MSAVRLVICERTCEQHGCGAPAPIAFDWPGQEQKAACVEHARLAVAVAQTIGFLLPITKLPTKEIETNDEGVRSRFSIVEVD